MMETKSGATMGSEVGGEGEQIRRRRERHHLTKSELARRLRISRDTLHDIEAGKGYQQGTMRKILEGLAELDAEAGFDSEEEEPEPGPESARLMTEVEVSSEFGVVRAVVRGPVADIEALEPFVLRMVRAIRSQDDDSDDAQ